MKIYKQLVECPTFIHADEREKEHVVKMAAKNIAMLALKDGQIQVEEVPQNMISVLRYELETVVMTKKEFMKIVNAFKIIAGSLGSESALHAMASSAAINEVAGMLNSAYFGKEEE